MIKTLKGLGEYDGYYRFRRLLIGLKFEVEGNKSILISLPNKELTELIDKCGNSGTFTFHQPKWEDSPS